jgi:hypothetical protein
MAHKKIEALTKPTNTPKSFDLLTRLHFTNAFGIFEVKTTHVLTYDRIEFLWKIFDSNFHILRNGLLSISSRYDK